MSLRLVRPGGPAVAIGYLLGPGTAGARDAALRAALPGCAIVADATSPKVPDVDAALGLVPQSTGELVLVGWSMGGQTLRTICRSRVDANVRGRDVAAVVVADGTHAPIDGGPWQRATWERLATLARGGGLVFVASCTQNTYVEHLTAAQGGPYASTRTVLDWIAGRPMVPGTELHEGGLHLYSYPSGACDAGAHVRALDALPGLLERHVAPLLSGDAPPVSDTIPAPPPFQPRGGTALSLAVLDAARAVLACGYMETPPGSNRHPWIDGVLRALGVPLGSSYCAAAASALLREATRATGLAMPVAGSAGARALLAQFSAAGRSLPPDRWREVYPGCLAFWPRGTGWQGHVGVVEEVRADGGLVCLEANARVAEVIARVVHPESEVRLGFGLV